MPDKSHIKYSVNQFTIGFYGDSVNNNYISVKQLNNNENKTVLSSRNIVTNATAPNGLLANLTYAKIIQYDEIRVNIDGVDYDCIPEYGTDPNGDNWVKLGGTARFAKNEPFSITAFDGNDAAIIAFDKSGDHIISAIGLDVAYNSYVVLASPNGTKYQITVSDGGALSATAI